MDLLQMLVIAVVAFFCIVFWRDGFRKFIGYNPAAPSLWARLKAWWPGFVKRHIVDDDPYDDESHAETRYGQRDDYIDWSKVPDRFRWVAVEESGQVFCWETKPTNIQKDMITGLGGWNTGRSFVGPNVNTATTGPLPPWRESLRKRPGK